MALTLGFIGFEVDEFSGSEGGVGYQWLRAASSVCDQVTVFTRADLSGPSLISITELPNVTAVLIPPPLIIAKNKKPKVLEIGIFRYVLNIGYRIWLRRVASHIELSNFEFDLIHYCTYVGYRFRTGLESGSTPILRGPVGGLENSRLDRALSVGFGTFFGLLIRNIFNSFDRSFSIESKDAMAGQQVVRVISAHQGIQSILYDRFGIRSACFPESPAINVGPSKAAADRQYNCVVVWNGSPQKRITLVAWAVLLAKSNICLDVFGPPITQDDLPREARALFSNEKIRCHGFVERSTLIEFMSKSTFFATFSLKDLSSVSLIEALSVGAIPVVSDDNGFKYLVDHNRGAIFSANGGFALALEASHFFDLLFDMHSLRDFMHLKNSQWIADEFSNEKLVQFLRNQYYEAVSRE